MSASPIKPVEYVPCGTSPHGVFESVYFEGKPALLIYENRVFRIELELDIGDKILKPLIAAMCPYEPYTFTDRDIQRLNSPPYTVFPRRNKDMLEMTFREFDTFCDIASDIKLLEAAYCLLTYIQHKIDTVPYLYHYGLPESGKGRFLEIHSWLSYRPLHGIKIPPSNVYTFLGFHDEGLGTIIEEESHMAHEESDKMTIYRGGYRKGAKAARISFDRLGNRKQRFYNIFCCKVFDGYSLPRDDGFATRCIPIHVVEGNPKKDEIDDSDKNRLRAMRNELLVWRMMTYFHPLPPITTAYKNRFKEIWKPLLQVGEMASCFSELDKLSNRYWTEKKEDMAESLEGHITRAIARVYLDHNGDSIVFEEIWRELKTSLTMLEENKTKILTEEFGEVTKRAIAVKLKSILGITNKPERNGQTSTRKYKVPIGTLIKMAVRYGLEDATVTELRKFEQKQGTS